MSVLTSTAPAVVTDEHVVVAASVVDPVVVTFDGQYVWSFSPRRDGVRSRGGWQVPWPEVMRDLLDGTTRVRLSDADGETRALRERRSPSAATPQPLALPRRATATRSPSTRPVT